MTARPHVSTDPAVCSGVPCIAGTRLSVTLVACRVWRSGVEDAMEDWDITRDQVLVACWWVARHGTRKWRERWACWLHDVEGAMWSGDREGLPSPPMKEPGP